MNTRQRNPASLYQANDGPSSIAPSIVNVSAPDDIVTVGRDARRRITGVCRPQADVLKEGIACRYAICRGLIVDSGNDARGAGGLYRGGQPQFVWMMNSYVKNSLTGIPILKPSTVWMRRDKQKFAYMIWPLPGDIHGEPEFYHMYSEKVPDPNGITQQEPQRLVR